MKTLKNLFRWAPTGLLPALIVALVTACTDTTVDEAPLAIQNQAPEAIQFGTYLRKLDTRAGTAGPIASNTDLYTNGGFGVFAYSTGATAWANDQTSFNANFMYNQAVTSADGTTWSYSPVKYWPNDYSTSTVDNNDPASEDQAATGSVNGGKISFFAYAPYVASPSGSYGITAVTGPTVQTSPKVTYKLADDGTGKYVDLLWGVKTDADPLVYNTNLTKQNTTEKVGFIFKHALAKMGGVGKLKAKLDVDNNAGGALLDAFTNVTIKSISIQNVSNAWANEGVFDLAAGTWSGSSATVAEGAALTVTLNSTNLAATLYSDDGTGVTYSAGWSPVGLSNSAVDVYKAGETDAPFYIIPGIANQKIKVTIRYTVKTYDDAIEGDYVTHTSQITNIVDLGSLSPNKYYTLLMHIGLTSVKFSATVNAWDGTSDDSEQEEVWLPSNVVTP